MSDREPRDAISLDGYLSREYYVRNATGGRGWDRGIRVFDCPFCGDTKARGWMNVTHWAAGCFKAGCVAEPTLSGGAVEWVQRREGLGSRPETWYYLFSRFRASAATRPQPVLAVAAPPADWVRFPAETWWLRDTPPDHPFLVRVGRFLRLQWGLAWSEALAWDLGWVRTGRHRSRLVIPVVQDGQAVSFQTRTVVPGAEPKYLTARVGPPEDPLAECGRGAAALLFNADRVRPGDAGIL